MMLVIHHDSPLSGWQKLAVSLALWAMATAWAGMLEAKRWSVPLEALRLLVLCGAIALWTPWASLAAVWGVASLGWLVAGRVTVAREALR